MVPLGAPSGRGCGLRQRPSLGASALITPPIRMTPHTVEIATPTPPRATPQSFAWRCQSLMWSWRARTASTTAGSVDFMCWKKGICLAPRGRAASTRLSQGMRKDYHSVERPIWAPHLSPGHPGYYADTGAQVIYPNAARKPRLSVVRHVQHAADLCGRTDGGRSRSRWVLN